MSGRRARGDGSCSTTAPAACGWPRSSFPATPTADAAPAARPAHRPGPPHGNCWTACVPRSGRPGRSATGLTVGRWSPTTSRTPRPRGAHPVTLQVYAGHAARITAGLGRVRLTALTAVRVERFLACMAADGYATRPSSARRGLLRAAIRRAQRDGRVPQRRRPGRRAGRPRQAAGCSPWSRSDLLDRAAVTRGGTPTPRRHHVRAPPG